MKKLLTALFLLVSAVALGMAVFFYLANRADRADASKPIATRRLVMAPEKEPGGGSEAALETEATENRIGALPNEVILDVESLNLDPDEGEEQILTVRKTNRSDGRLSLVVADYLPERRTWVRSWECDLPITKLTTLQTQALDILGDHTLCIVATGMNDSNEQTIAVFRRKAAAPDRTELLYEPIAELSGDAVVVEEVERTEGYQLGQTNGASFPIVVYRRDRDSANILDQVRTRYAWDFQKGSYVEAGSEKIPGAVVEKEKAARILTGKEEDFERFLAGAWYDDSAGPGSGNTRIISFDRAAGSIVFYSADAQELFRWTESHSTRYGLYIGAQNESVTNLRRLMDIELSGADSISVRIFEDLRMKIDGDNRWEGTYRRASSVQGPVGASRTLPAFKLEGAYAGPGMALRFDGRRFAMDRGEVTERGGYYLYTIGSDAVLELVILKDNGLVESRRSYRARYTETRTGKTIVRNLRLSPANLSITGLELRQETDIVLEQRVDC